MKNSHTIKKYFKRSAYFLMAMGVGLTPFAGRADTPMQTPPTIYQLPQQTGDNVVEGSYPATLQIGNFDTSASSTDAIGNDFNEVGVVGTTDTFLSESSKAPPDGYANIWSVVHNGSADPASLSVINPLSLVVPGSGPGTQYAQTAHFFDLNGDGVDDLNFLGGKALGLCDPFVLLPNLNYGSECSVLSVFNVTPSTAPFFDPNSLASMSDTTGQYFGIPVGPAFTQVLLQAIGLIGGGSPGILSGNPLQDVADDGNDGDTDVFYYDFAPPVPPAPVPVPIKFSKNALSPVISGPTIVTLENDGAGGFTSRTNLITLPDSLSDTNFKAINVGDFNGDGEVDVALLFAGISIFDLISGSSPPFPSNELLIYNGNGDGTFGSGASPFSPNQNIVLADSFTTIPVGPIPPLEISAHFVNTLANGDFDNDGVQDFVVGSVGIGVDLDPGLTNVFVSTAPYNHIVLCSGAGCNDTPVLASPFLNFIVKNAVADFNNDGLDDIATATISPGLLGLLINILPSNNDSEVRLYLNQGAGSFNEPENADQVFQVPLANIIDPDTGKSLGGFLYGISDIVAGNIDNCGGPDLAYSSFVCPTDFDPNNPDQNPFQVCFPGIIPLVLSNGTATKTININDTDTTTPGAVSVVLNEILPPVVGGITVAKNTGSSVNLTTTCTTDGNEASKITWTLDTPIAGASIQNANQPTATLVLSQSAGGNVTVSVTCADACNSVSTSTSFNLSALLEGSKFCSMGLGGSPADYSLVAFVLIGLLGRRLLKK